MAKNMIIYYSRIGATFGKGLAIHGADASKSEGKVAAWAEKVLR